MKLAELVTGTRAMELGMFLSRHAPPAVAHRAAWLAAGAVCRARPAAYRIVQANLGQALGPGAERATLDGRTREVFYTLVRSTYDLYRALQRPRDELAALVEFGRVAQSIVRGAGRATVLISAHLGNFDLGGQAVAACVPGIQLLSLPNPPPAFRRANDLRRGGGIDVTPLSAASLRQALQKLKRGGIVALAGDRPVSDLDDPIPFFGRPARMPSGPVRLALKTDARIVVLYCILNAENGGSGSAGAKQYTVHVEPPLDLVRTGNRDEEVQINMRRVLDVLERVIRRWPGQWQMFAPVWPAEQS